MAKFVKAILFLLFAVALHSVADNFSADRTVGNEECVPTYNSTSQVSRAQLPYLPEGELTTNAAQTNQMTTSRIQRINLLEYSISLKALTHKYLLREATLAQHLARIYDTTTSYCCHPASEYYIFALRRIII